MIKLKQTCMGNNIEQSTKLQFWLADAKLFRGMLPEEIKNKEKFTLHCRIK